jgi:hypothetical protein
MKKKLVTSKYNTLTYHIRAYHIILHHAILYILEKYNTTTCLNDNTCNMVTDWSTPILTCLSSVKVICKVPSLKPSTGFELANSANVNFYWSLQKDMKYKHRLKKPELWQKQTFTFPQILVERLKSVQVHFIYLQKFAEIRGQCTGKERELVRLFMVYHPPEYVILSSTVVMITFWFYSTLLTDSSSRKCLKLLAKCLHDDMHAVWATFPWNGVIRI